MGARAAVGALVGATLLRLMNNLDPECFPGASTAAGARDLVFLLVGTKPAPAFKSDLTVAHVPHVVIRASP